MISQDGLIEYSFIHENSAGARASGMGKAFRALSDDYTASIYNPAGLTQLKRFEVFGEILNTNYSYTANIKNQPSASPTTINKTRFGTFGFVAPYPTYRGSLVFSFGKYNSNVFDKLFKLSYNDTLNSILRKDSYSGALQIWNASGAIDISPKISAGLSVNYWTGDNFNELTGSGIKEVLDSKFSGINLNAGILLKIHPNLKIALALDTPHSLTENINYFLDSLNNQSYYNYKIKYAIPFKMSGGAALFLPRTIITMDFEAIDWRQTTVDKVKEDSHKFVINSYTGIEILIPKINLKIRSGYMYTPVALTVNQITQERRTFSVGLGTIIDKIMTVDMALLFTNWQVNNSEIFEDGTEVNEDFKIIDFLLTIAYRY